MYEWGPIIGLVTGYSNYSNIKVEYDRTPPKKWAADLVIQLQEKKSRSIQIGV